MKFQHFSLAIGDHDLLLDFLFTKTMKNDLNMSGLYKWQNSVNGNTILYKIEAVNCVSVFQNYQSFSDVITERPKPASENSEPIKRQ